MTPAARTLVRSALEPLSREQVDIAIPLLREALAIDPSDADAQALLATALVASGKVDEGIALADAAAMHAPDAFLPRLKAGEISVRIGDLVGAEAHFLAALGVASIGSRDAEAARIRLADVRVRSRRAIDHHARMPALGVGARVRSLITRRPIREPRRATDATDGESGPARAT